MIRLHRSLRLFVAAFLVASTAVAVQVHHASALTQLGTAWTFKTSYSAAPKSGETRTYSSPAVGDLFGDGHKEVVAAFPDGSIHVLQVNAANNGVSELWHYQTGGAINASPTLVDLFNDGRLEVFVTSRDGNVYGFYPDGTLLPGWPQRAYEGPAISNGGYQSAWFGSVAAGDLFGDGQKELVAASWDTFLYGWNARGTQLGGFPVRLWDSVWDTPALASLQHDGKLDIVIGSDSSGGYEPEPPGGVMWALPPSGCSMAPSSASSNLSCNLQGFPKTFDEVPWSSPAAVDLNGTSNSSFNIVEGTGHYWAQTGFPTVGKYVNAWGQDGSQTWTVSTPSQNFSSPAVGDLASPSSHDTVVASEDGTLHAWNESGSQLWATNCRGNGCGLSSPIIAPLDGSHSSGVWIATGNEVDGFDRSGNLLYYGPMDGAAVAAPTEADLGNGQLSLVEVSGTAAAGTSQQWEVQAFVLPGSPTSMPALSWPTFHGNMQRSGEITPQAQAPTATTASPDNQDINLSWSLASNSVPASSYSLYVSTDGGAYTYYKTTTSTSAKFYGTSGHTYKFYVQAANAAGYTELGPAANASAPVVAGSTGPLGASFHGFYTVDAYGHLNAGDSPTAIGQDWSGFRIARGIGLLSGGRSGYILDGFGGLHPFAAPGTSTPASASLINYWPNWDIMRGLAMDPCHPGGGFAVDAYGGLWAFGTEPLANQYTYHYPSSYHGGGYGTPWLGFDIVRGIAINPTCSGGVTNGEVLDGFGGVHPFTTDPNQPGSAGFVDPSPVSQNFYWPNFDIGRGIVMSANNKGYVLDGFGGVHPFGGADTVTNSGYWPNWDIARSIVEDPAGSEQGWVIDGYGGTHPFGFGSVAPTLDAQYCSACDDLNRGAAAN